MTIPNWFWKLRDAYRRRGVFWLSGGNYHYRILHDDWCDRLNGRGSCNCDPEIAEIWRARDSSSP